MKKHALLIVVVVLAGSFHLLRGHKEDSLSPSLSETTLEDTGLPPANTVVSHPAEMVTVVVSPEVKPDVDGELALRIDELLSSDNEADHETVFADLLPLLILHDPAAASGLAEKLEAGGLHERMIRVVAQGWANQDAAAALGWAQGIKDPAECKTTLTHICFQIAQASPAEAVTTAALYNLEACPGVVENLVQTWATKDFSAALMWVEAHPDDEFRDQMFSRVAYVESETDPVAAVNFVVDKIPPGPAQDEAAISVLHQWAMRDEIAAAGWVENFPPGSLRQRAENELVGMAQYRAPN